MFVGGAEADGSDLVLVFLPDVMRRNTRTGKTSYGTPFLSGTLQSRRVEKQKKKIRSFSNYMYSRSVEEFILVVLVAAVLRQYWWFFYYYFNFFLQIFSGNCWFEAFCFFAHSSDAVTSVCTQLQEVRWCPQTDIWPLTESSGLVGMSGAAGVWNRGGDVGLPSVCGPGGDGMMVSAPPALGSLQKAQTRDQMRRLSPPKTSKHHEHTHNNWSVLIKH